MGGLRLFLAIAVMANHTIQWSDAGGLFSRNPVFILGVTGPCAVVMFFTISGFLMSTVLSNKYKPCLRDTLLFYKSRFLRIYPLWWALLFLVIVYFEPEWAPARPLSDILSVTTLVGPEMRTAFAAYPDLYPVLPSVLGLGWSLAPEVAFYAIAPFVLRSFGLSAALCIGSFALRWWLFQSMPAQWASWCYLFTPTLLGFFLLGHFSRLLWAFARKRGADPRLCFPFLAVTFGLTSFAGAGSGMYDNVTFYAALAFFVLALPMLFDLTKDSKALNFAGNLTYPFYLIHHIFLKYALTFSLFGTSIYSSLHYLDTDATYSAWKHGAVLWFTILLTLPVAWIAHVAIERPATRALAAMIGLIGGLVRKISPHRRSRSVAVTDDIAKNRVATL